MANYEVVYTFPNTEGYPLVYLENEISASQFGNPGEIIVPEKEIEVFSDQVPHASFSGRQYTLKSSSDQGFTGVELAKKFQESWLKNQPRYQLDASKIHPEAVGHPYLMSLIRDRSSEKYLVVVLDA